MRASVRLLLPVLFLAACGDSEPEVPSSITVTPASVTFDQVGQTQQFVAQAQDATGKNLNVNVTWSSSDESVASVTATGLATAVNTGSATIRAAVENVSGAATVEVAPAVASVEKVAGDQQTWEINESVPVDPTVEVRDGGGAGVAGQTVTWTVVDGGGSVSVGQSVSNASGLASTTWTLGSTAGAAQTLRATVGGTSADFTATAAVGLLRITTSSLSSARQATAYTDDLTAAGGSGSGYTFSVTDGALPTGISLATDGGLSGTTSNAGAFPFTAQVMDGAGGTATRDYVFLVCDPALSLSPGDFIVTTAQEAADCGIFLPAGTIGDTYRVTLMRAIQSEGTGTVSASLTMDADGPLTVQTATPNRIASLGPRLRMPEGLEAELRVAAATEEFHVRLRDAERRLVARLGPESMLRTRTRGATQDGQFVAAASRMPDPPSVETFSFPSVPSGPTACQSGQSTPATLVGFNDRLAIYQANSIATTSDSIGQTESDRILDYYQAYGHQVIEDYFGGTSDINGDERVVMVAVPQSQISQVGGNVAAFVWSGDFFPATSTTGASCAASDEMELIYFNADIINNMRAGTDTYQALATTVHEVKHVSSLYNRLRASSGSSPFHPTFIEEGTAEVAGEISSRLAWADGTGPSVGSEVNDTHFQSDGFTPENWGVVLRLARTTFYLSSQPNGVAASPSAAQGGINGSGWLFHRYLGDAYGGASSALADSALFREQNDSLTVGGFPAYPLVVGESYTDLLEEYAIAVTLNGTGNEPARTFTTYDLPTAAEIFSLPDPAGTFPWPVTRTCNGSPCSQAQLNDIESEEGGTDNDTGVMNGITFSDRTYAGTLGVGGIRVHEFVSSGTGSGAEITVDATSDVRVIVARIN